MGEPWKEVTSEPSIYFDPTFKTEAAKLLPGEFYVTGEDMLLVTVLGSCVAACIRDVRSKIGGMNHFMLPDAAQDANNPLSTSARYGGNAMEILINELIKKGAVRANLEAKVFGGGNVLHGMTNTNVGQRNADFVLQYLNTEKIRLVAQDLVDIYPRKVYYFPHTGMAKIRKLKTTHDRAIIEREKEYSARIVTSKVSGGDIELF
jgi:chemotaxis protein CheD